ncbi:MAG: UDP-N-acetylmuramoyl-tripeptide--D-alanyl-D-alanine ligase [Burkholderiales bacterium]
MLTLDEIAAVLGAGRIGANVEFFGVSTDSRKIARGDLFVALKGANHDGAEFVPIAGQAGAVAAIVERQVESAIPLLVVKDARLALGKLAAFWRSRFGIPVIAITGSNGKTTVKEMLASILREKGEVLATKGNLNNDIGLPLTLLGLRREHRFAVIEMGMNHPGEIEYLCSVARPDFALVTNAASAHLEGLGSVAAVARAKGEIFEGLKQDGAAIINADDAYAPLWRGLAKGRRIVDFGLNGGAGVTARYVLDEYGSDIVLNTPKGEIGTRLQVPGLHNVRNALAAAAAASAAGIDAKAIGQGLAKFAGVAGRMQRKTGRKGAILVDDTYNANPDSVRAAIAWLSNAKGKTLLILGDMGELGPDSSKLHGEIGIAARDAGIGALLTLGKASKAAAVTFGKGANHFEAIETLVGKAQGLLEPGMTVLVKGSRFMKMERVVEQLEEREKACC